MKKKIGYVVFILFFLFFAHLSLRYFLNEVYIGKYNDGIYDNKIVNFLMFLNYPESYIAHYNKGNNLYQTEEYKEATDEYLIALETVPKSRKCMVIVNLSFAKFQLVDMENQDTIVRDLKAIQKILLQDNCATKDGKGTNKDAQNFYDEIEKLLNSQGQGQGDDDDDDDNDDDNDNPQDNPDDYKELEEKLKKQQEQSFDERNRVDPREYEYYNGKKW